MTDSDTREAIRRHAQELAAQAPGWSIEQRQVLARLILPRVQEVAA